MLQRFQRKPTFPLELERVLDMLYKAPEVSQDTRPHSRGMLKFPPQVKKNPIFLTSSRDEGRLPCFTWKGNPISLSLVCGVEPGGVVTIQKPRISPSTRDQA